MALRSFGKITIAVPGTKVRATVNETTPATRVGVQSLSIYAPASNTGDVYVGIGASFSTSTYAGLIGIIPKGTWWSSVVNLAPAGLNAADYYLDAANGADVALVVATEQ